MKAISTLIMTVLTALSGMNANAQSVTNEDIGLNRSRLNTAAGETYMTDSEQEMILEINMLLSDPKKYSAYLQPYLDEAKERLNKYGNGERNNSINTSYSGSDMTPTSIDTVWHYRNEEEVRAIESLMNDLMTI